MENLNDLTLDELITLRNQKATEMTILSAWVDNEGQEPEDTDYSKSRSFSIDPIEDDPNVDIIEITVKPQKVESKSE